METTIRTFRSGSLKQRTSQPILPYADSPNHTSSRGGRAFKQQGSNTCRNLVGAVLVAALLGLATVAFTGVPGVVQPGFRRTKKTAAAQQTHDDHDADSVDEHWHHDEHTSHDYVGDDHEEQSEQAILDHQIRMEQEHAGSHHADHLPGDTHTAHHEQHEQQHHDEHEHHEHHEQQHDEHEQHEQHHEQQHDEHEQHEQQHEQHDEQHAEQHEEHAADHPFDHDAVHTHAQQVGELARDIQMKKGQAELAGVHGEQGKAAHPQELLASIAEMQKQVPTPAPTPAPAPTEQQLPQAGDQQQHQDSQQQEHHTAQEAVASPAPTPAPEPVPTPAPQADGKQADSKADPTQPVVATGIYALSARDKDDHEVALSQYAGKVTIVVNVASQCGYTQQNYKGLVELYKDFKDKGFEVLAFPCNAFGKQEPGSCSEIQHFAEEQFHATFPIFNKIEVNGPNTHPVFKFLKDHTPLGHGGGADVDWNFAKWVVNKKGYPVVRYPSAMDISALRGWIDYEVSRN